MTKEFSYEVCSLPDVRRRRGEPEREVLGARPRGGAHVAGPAHCTVVRRAAGRRSGGGPRRLVLEHVAYAAV